MICKCDVCDIACPLPPSLFPSLSHVIDFFGTMQSDPYLHMLRKIVAKTMTFKNRTAITANELRPILTKLSQNGKDVTEYEDQIQV